MVGFELAVACMALNIYWEAGFEPLAGKQAVALVTLNRMKSKNMDTCDVVFEPHQFSWANNARDDKGRLFPEFMPKKNKNWIESKRIARKALGSELKDFTNGAMFYYADYIAKPTWAREMKLSGKWGRHYFYK